VTDEIRGFTPASGRVAADFDRDGVLDLAIARRGESAIHLYRGASDLKYQPAGTAALDEPVIALDAHHDSARAVGPDLVIRTEKHAGTRLLPGNGDFTFREAVAAGKLDLDPARPLLVDLDANGAVDRVVRNGRSAAPVFQAGATHGIAKTHTGTFTRGGTAEYRIVVNGPAPGLTFEVSDPIPAGLTVIQDLGFGFPWECGVDNNVVQCFGSHLSPGANGNFPAIVIPVAIAVNAPAVISNTATITDESGTASSTDTVTLGGGGSPDLTVAKTHTGNFPAGGSGVFSITVTNVGTAATTAPTVVNDLPQAGLTVASMGGTGWVCDVAARQCSNSGVLSPGASFPPITVSVTVASSAPNPAQNNAVVSGGGDANAANNTSIDTVTVTRPDPSITKTHSGNFREGQTGAVYTLTVTNVGNSATVGEVAVVDTLPSPLAAQSMAGPGWTCTLAALRCTRTDALAPGASYPAITVTVNVPAPAPVSVTNRADVSGGGDTNTANNQALDPTTIQRIDLTITKTHVGNFLAGSRASYTITVTNAGTAASTGTVTVVDNVPAALSNPAISGAGWACVLTPQVSCSRSDALSAGASYPAITFEGTVAAGAPASFDNTATVSGGGDSNGANNTAIDSTSTQVADLAITKTHVGNFYPTQRATWTITVSNVGNGATTGEVRVTESPQGQFRTVSLSGPGWTCTTSVCTRSDVLRPGMSYPPITYTADIDAVVSFERITNVARVEGGGDANAANNEAIDEANIDRADLTIAKTHTGDFTQGQFGATWSIVVTNRGAAPTFDAVRVDEFPQGGSEVYSVVSIAGDGWTCTLGAQPFCTRTDALAPGASYPPITFTVNINHTAPAQVENLARVSGGRSDSNLTNNEARDSARVRGPDFVITKTHVGNFRQGQPNAQYTLVVTNNGDAASPADASFPVAVTELPPTPSPFTSFTMAGAGWTCSGASCQRNDALGAGASYPAITVTAVISGTATDFTNQARVDARNDQNTANNTASDPTVVRAADPDLAITKTHVGNFYPAQRGAMWTITVSNVGNGATTGEVRVNESPQGYYRTVSLSGPGWTCTTSACTRSDVLRPGMSYPPITYTADIDAVVVFDRIYNVARLEGGGDTNAANNEAIDQVNIDRPDLTITKGHLGDFRQGQPIAFYALTVTNVGRVATNGLVEVTELPPSPSPFVNFTMAGPGWTCAGATCGRSNSLAPGASYPPVIVTARISNTATSFTNQALVTHPGDTNTANNTASDPTTVNPGTPDLSIDKSHAGSFIEGQVNAVYTISVRNVGVGAVSSAVTVTDVLPAALTATAISGPGWACTLATLSCTRGDTLASGADYPPVTVTVNVARNAPPVVINRATVSGGGDTNPLNNIALDPTRVVSTPLNVNIAIGPAVLNPATGRFRQVVTLRNNGANLAALAFVLDALPGAVTMIAPDGLTAATTPAGSPYREWGAMPNGAQRSITLEFTRIGNAPIQYNPRLIGPGPR